MKCHCCESENLNKYGKNSRGNQRYRCKICYSISIQNGKFTWMTDSEKNLIEKLVKEGVSIRGIARVLGRDFNSIYIFLKKNSKKVL